ncbi:MAG: STAS domain-containing protein [Alkalispirochaeta sp.]
MPSDAGMYFWCNDDELFLFIRGRVTATEAYSMYRHVEEWTRVHQESSVFVDLDNATYIDSTTIGTLIRLHKQQRAHGGSLVICNPSDAVANVIEKTKLSNYFTIIEDEELHAVEKDYLETMPRHHGTDVDSSFVLDAHNDICRVRPELTPKFQGLISELKRHGSSKS